MGPWRDLRASKAVSCRHNSLKGMPMKLTTHDIAQLIDASVVRAEVSASDLQEFAQTVRKYHFIGAHVLPCYVAELKGLLEGESDILIGTGAGFPSGAHTTAVKVHEAEQAFKDGCDELDMVVNIGALRSGRYKHVEHEIRAIVRKAAGKTVKVILEVHYLTSDEIKRGCDLAIKAGADFVKTSTGWAPTGATPENVALIKSFVGDAIRIKAAGGIRDLATLVEMYKLGATRFGLGAKWAVKVVAECNSAHSGSVEV